MLVDRLPVLAAVLLLALAFSGCAGKSPGSADPATTDDVIVDATGAVQKDEPPAKETVQTPAGAVAVNKGLLVGRVHDAGNFSISGASVAVLGTEVHGKTSLQGTFRFENLTPGAFDIRIEAASFTPQEQRVTIAAGKEALLDITLEIKDGLDPGMAPHIHDYWGDDTQWVLMDEVVPVPDRIKPQKTPQTDLLRGNNDQRWPFVLPDQEQGKPATIWPGTKEVRFTLSWGSEAENTVPNAVVLLQNHRMEVPLELTPVTSSGGSTSYVLTTSNETDLGHSGATTWQFWLNIKNSPQGSTTAFRPTLAMDGIGVKVTLVKGDLVLEAAHQDFWQGNDTLPIGDQARGCTPNTGVPPATIDHTESAPQYWVCPIHALDNAVNIIPPGTQKIRVEFSWTHTQVSALPFTYHLTYRTAAQSPAQTPVEEYRTPTIVEESGNRILYEIVLEPGDVDGFYQERSLWGFKWHLDDNQGYQSGFIVKFGLAVTAFKDPAYA